MKTINEIVNELTPAEAKQEAKELKGFIRQGGSVSHKDFIWLELLNRRAKAKK